MDLGNTFEFHGCNNKVLEYDGRNVFITHLPTLFREKTLEFISTDDILFVYRELPSLLKNGMLSIASRSTDKFLKIEFSKDQLPEINKIYEFLDAFAKENSKKPIDDLALKINVRVGLDDI